jgi:hypothetical protein
VTGRESSRSGNRAAGPSVVALSGDHEPLAVGDDGHAAAALQFDGLLLDIALGEGFGRPGRGVEAKGIYKRRPLGQVADRDRLEPRVLAGDPAPGVGQRHRNVDAVEYRRHPVGGHALRV